MQGQLVLRLRREFKEFRNAVIRRKHESKNEYVKKEYCK